MDPAPTDPPYGAGGLLGGMLRRGGIGAALSDTVTGAGPSFLSHALVLWYLSR